MELSILTIKKGNSHFELLNYGKEPWINIKTNEIAREQKEQQKKAKENKPGNWRNGELKKSRGGWGANSDRGTWL
jgi:hypothetical protein